jgi:NADH dehydrogenase
VILVAGGTGRLGSVLVSRLVARGEDVRVLTRDPTRARHLVGVEVVVGDVRRRGDLVPALLGVSAVVSAVHGFVGADHVTPASVDRDGNAHLIEAATTVGARFVLMSVVGASPTHPLELFRMKAAAEQELRQSTLRWTIVRAGAFLELYQDLLRPPGGRGRRPVVFGRGDNPIQFSRVDTVARAVDRALGDDATGTVIEVDGPLMTMNQLAGASDSELSRPRHVPRLVLRTLAAARGTSIGRQGQAALVMDRCNLRTGERVESAGGRFDGAS